MSNPWIRPVVRCLGVVWLVVAGAGGCQASGGMPAVEVYPTGEEARVLKFLDEGGEAAAPGHFADSLDHVYSVLLTKAFPTPDAVVLRTRAVAAMAQAFQRQTGQAVSVAAQQSLVEAAGRPGGFAAVLEQLKSRAAAGSERDRLVEAGLNGLVGGAASRSHGC